MNTQEIINEISNLSLRERLIIIKKAIESIKDAEISQQLHLAAEEMQAEYKKNKELTSFTSIDMDPFYEPR